MFAYIGGYTTPDRDGRGNGINVYNVQPGGAWTRIQTVGNLENPSLFTLNAAQTRLYTVHGGRSLVSAFTIDAVTGHLTLLNQVDPGGGNPVDLALDPTERFLVVANYGAGTVAVLPLGEDGELNPPSQLVTLEGRPGPNPKEQSSSHPHGVIFDPGGQFVIVPDKGFDKTFIFRFEDGRLSPTEQAAVVARPGAAPRHCAFHPKLPVLYVNNELDSTVIGLRLGPCDRPSDREAGDRHAAAELHWPQHHCRDRSLAGWSYAVCLKSRPGQHRVFRRRTPRLGTSAIQPTIPPAEHARVSSRSAPAPNRPTSPTRTAT